MNVIQTNQLTKQFKDYTALDHIDFTVKEGEICAIIGKNGAGKSTLFKLLSNRFLSTEGTVQLFGKSSHEKQSVLPKISFLIEDPGFFDDFTARQNLEYFRLQEGIPDKKRIDEVLRIVELDFTGSKIYRHFSIGMKQRMGIALALLSNPDCMVLDEPTNGLDAEGITEIRHLLQRLNQEFEVTLVISSHILSELQLLATRFVFIDTGRVVADISREELADQTARKLILVISDPAKVAQLLERHFPDIEYQVLPDRSFEIVNHLNDRDQINSLLVQNGIRVSGMHMEEGKLEDYFFDLIGGDKQ